MGTIRSERQILQASFIETDVEHRICNSGKWGLARFQVSSSEASQAPSFFKTVSCSCPQKREDSASTQTAHCTFTTGFSPCPLDDSEVCKLLTGYCRAEHLTVWAAQIILFVWADPPQSPLPTRHSPSQLSTLRF